MRPIRLEFAGLQSYREAQVVDFETLLGGGLFGIFGPTGSGKSTILDAITLALYGTVTRSEGSTRGIMNHAENRLWVQFSFSLADAVGPRRYLIERNYRRQASGAIATSGCRLVERIGTVDQVLADKDRDLTAQVTKILGLTEEDFTKAVVLPQGKFAEFMSMKDATRRQMLQRIFGLGQYGDRLQSRMKVQTETVRRALQEVEGRQGELGDASAEALAQVETALSEAEQQLSTARGEAEAVEQDHKIWERVWTLQQELVLLRAQIAAWQGDLSESESRATELARAERAEILRHPLADERQGRDQLVQLARTADQCTRAWTAAQALEAQERSAHLAALARRTSEHPGLSESVIQLRQAVGLEGEIESLAAAITLLADRVARGQTKTDEVEGAIRHAEALVAQVQERRDAVLAELTSSAISAAHKEQVGAAFVTLQALQAAESQQSEVARRLTRRVEEVARASASVQAAKATQQEAEALLTRYNETLAHKQAAPPFNEEGLRFEERWLSGAQAHVRAVTDALGRVHWATEARRRLEQESAQLQTRLAQAVGAEATVRAALVRAQDRRSIAQQGVDEVQIGQHAATLVVGLTPGSACPVCGSLEHPHPAEPLDPSALLAAQHGLRTADQELAGAQAALESAIRSLAEAQAAVGATQIRAAAAAEEERLATATLESVRLDLPRTLQELDPAALPQAINQELNRHAVSTQALQQWQTEVEVLRTQAQAQAQVVARGAVTLAGLTATHEAAAQSVEESRLDQIQADQLATKLQAEFDLVRGGFDREGLVTERQRLATVERHHAELTRELSDLGVKQQPAERTVAAERLRHDEYRAKLQRLQTEHQSNQHQFDEKRSLLVALAGTEPAAPQLAAAQARIRQLEAEEASTLTRREAAETGRSKAEVAAAEATKEHAIAQNRAVQARAALDAALERAGFEDALAAELALRTDQVRAQLSAWLRDREREGHRLQDATAKVEQELDGRHVSPTDWQAQQERRAQARANLEQCRDDRTRAAHAHQDLQTKQSRWRELEAERLSQQQAMSHLEELARLLRGGAFVEYLAGEQMLQVAQVASGRLGQLTGFRYGLVLDEDGGFVIRDDGNGGVRRSVSTLSGGETFLTSLSLALALSASIQLRGHYPLEFFFLDEGFGSLDPELLTIVIDTLERLQFEKLNVGLISHVPEIRNRLARRVIVTPADPGGRGSRLRLELA